MKTLTEHNETTPRLATEEAAITCSWGDGGEDGVTLRAKELEASKQSQDRERERERNTTVQEVPPKAAERGGEQHLNSHCLSPSFTLVPPIS
jgi:hypothetical protein